MSWPYYNGNGSLASFTVDQVNALGLETYKVRYGEHPTISVSSTECSARRMWFAHWSQRDNAIAYLLGASAIYGTFPDYKLSRVMPQVFPNAGYSQYAAMAVEDCKGAKSAGYNDAAGIPAYVAAEMTVRHEQVFFGLASDAQVAAGLPEYNRYVERLPSTVQTSYLSMPGSGMSYRTESGGAPNGVYIPYNVGKPEVMTKIAFKWWRVPYEAWVPGAPLYNRVHGDPSNITVAPVPFAPTGYGKVVGAPYIGTVSSAPMFGYPAGQALFVGVEEEIVPDPVRGFPAWNLTYQFLIKSIRGGPPNAPEAYGGHNYLYYGGPSAASSANSGYYLATKSSTFIYPNRIWDGACLFSERNLLNLWNVGKVPDADI